MHLICRGSFAMSMRFLRVCLRSRRRKSPPLVRPGKSKRASRRAKNDPLKNQRPGFLRGAVLPLLAATFAAAIGGGGKTKLHSAVARWRLKALGGAKARRCNFSNDL